MRLLAASSLLLNVVIVLGCSGVSLDPPEAIEADAEAPSDALGTAPDTTSTPSDGATVTPTPDTATPTPVDATSPDGGTASLAIDGYWVWKEIVEGGKVTRTITDEDMAWKVGPSGWPGCPSGISCTKYGIEVLYANATRLQHMQRVTTGSDYQRYGSYVVAGDLVTFSQAQMFSCAHPEAKASSYVKPATSFARIKRVGADLWMTPFAAAAPAADPAKWVVYRPISKVDAHNKYDHPYCGAARAGVEDCHCLCPSQDVLVDYKCAP